MQGMRCLCDARLVSNICHGLSQTFVTASNANVVSAWFKTQLLSPFADSEFELAQRILCGSRMSVAGRIAYRSHIFSTSQPDVLGEVALLAPRGNPTLLLTHDQRCVCSDALHLNGTHAKSCSVLERAVAVVRQPCELGTAVQACFSALFGCSELGHAFPVCLLQKVNDALNTSLVAADDFCCLRMLAVTA